VVFEFKYIPSESTGLQGGIRVHQSLLSKQEMREGVKSMHELKGHGNEADFLGFLQKSVRHRFVTLHFEPFRFGLRIC
jgi:hypothetical protein